MGVFTVAYMYVFGGYLVTVVALLLMGGDAGAWQSLLQNILVGLIFGGIIFALIGVALFIVGVVFKVRDWLRRSAADASREAGNIPTPRNPQAQVLSTASLRRHGASSDGRRAQTGVTVRPTGRLEADRISRGYEKLKRRR